MISLREITPADCHFVYECRNDPIARKSARETEKIPFHVHRTWFWKTIKENYVKFYIGKKKEGDVGVIRFTYGNPTEIAIHMYPLFKGRGYGTIFLQKSIERFCKENKNEKILMATIRPSNIGSRRIFEKAGFKPNGELDPKDHGFDVYLLNLK